MFAVMHKDTNNLLHRNTVCSLKRSSIAQAIWYSDENWKTLYRQGWRCYEIEIKKKDQKEKATGRKKHKDNK